MESNKVMFPLMIDREFKRKLMEHCKEQDVSLAAVVRALLREYAEREGI